MLFAFHFPLSMRCIQSTTWSKQVLKKNNSTRLAFASPLKFTISEPQASFCYPRLIYVFRRKHNSTYTNTRTHDYTRKNIRHPQRQWLSQAITRSRDFLNPPRPARARAITGRQWQPPIEQCPAPLRLGAFSSVISSRAHARGNGIFQRTSHARASCPPAYSLALLAPSAPDADAAALPLLLAAGLGFAAAGGITHAAVVYAVRDVYGSARGSFVFLRDDATRESAWRRGLGKMIFRQSVLWVFCGFGDTYRRCTKCM